MNRNFSLFAFVLGLFAVAWVAFGYIGGSPVALAVSCLIAAVYMAGAAEMRRFHQGTVALARALDAIPQPLGQLGDWLTQVPAGLQNSVRLRVEGERVALPGPALTPYLVGLLVLLGMLGTFLGMVVTLNGAVLALESTTDLHTIRSALSAPVKGLGVAFGTSVAGVASSAMLGLISSLCRRERQQVGHLLDAKIAGVLRDFSLTHQRQETFKALQVQAQALPELVGKLDAMLQAMSEQNRQLGDQLLAGQQRFHDETTVRYDALAQSVDQSLKSSLKDSATIAAETIQPVVSATMASIADETRALQGTLLTSVETQLAGVTGQFAQAVNTIGETWVQTLSRQEQAGEERAQQTAAALAAYADGFDQRSTALLAGVDTRLSAITGEFAQTAGAVSETLTQALNLHEQTAETQQRQLDATLTAYAENFAQRSASLLESVETTHAALRAEAMQQQGQLIETTAATQQQLAATLASQFDGVTQRLDQAISQVAGTFAERSQALLASVDASHAAFAETNQAQQAAISDQVSAQLDGIAQRFDGAVQTVSRSWAESLASHEKASDRLTDALTQTQQALAETFAGRTAALLADMRAAQAAWQSEWTAGEQARQARFAEALTTMAGTLDAQWRQAGELTQVQQAEAAQTLGDAVRELVAATQRQAETTIAEVTRLMQTAAEAPKAAAEVIGQLRHELSASIARDNGLLEERSRLMQTLATLLDAINHASTEQRSAIDALIVSSTSLLERVGEEFSAKVQGEAGKLVDLAAGITGGALEIASVGDAFGVAVQLFSESNDKMMSALQRIESALAKSLTRSDEQLAYYVAQAREIIDLSIMSQKKMVDDLQRVAQQNVADGEA